MYKDCIRNQIIFYLIMLIIKKKVLDCFSGILNSMIVWVLGSTSLVDHAQGGPGCGAEWRRALAGILFN